MTSLLLLVKYSTAHSYRYILTFLFVVICNMQSFSLNNAQTSNPLEEIKSLDTPIEQYRYFRKAIYNPNNEVENIKEWFSYFKSRKKKYSNNDEQIIYIDFILVYLYRQDYKLDTALELGLSTYYKETDVPKKNNILCALLRMLEWCYHKKDNNLGLLKINKEKFKVCDKGVVDYYSAYYNMGLYDLALKSYREHINYDKPIYQKHNLYDQAFHCNDFGVYFMYDNKIDSAFYYFNKSISLFKQQIEKDSTYKKEDTQFMLNIAGGNIATCLMKTGKYKQAIPLFLEELNSCNIYFKGTNWVGSEKTYNRIAYCYIKTNQFEKANFYINKLKNYKDLFYNLKSEYYNQQKKIDSTLYFKNRYIITSDSIAKHKLMHKDLESLNLLNFNERLKQQEIEINRLEKIDNTNSIKIKVYLITSFVVLFLFLLLLYLYYDIRKKQSIVEAQKSKIETALNNNKTLLKELNHRVKNNLQMVSSVISLQASKIKDDGSKKHFYRAVNRVKVLSKIHNSLYSKNDLDEIDLLAYVNTLKDYLIKSIIHPEILVGFNINIAPNLYINNDTKTTIGLIINELITNSFKYAFKDLGNNLITISITKKEDVYYFSYKDNGIGFDYNAIDKSKSIGLNLILRLVNQLGEEAEIKATNGMVINFKFEG